MRLNTKHFGEVGYDADEIITFEEGLPGFKDTEFILLADNPDDLFCWLQSTADGDLAFVLVDVKQIKPDYNPKIEPEAIESLSDGSPLSYYNVAVVPEDISQMRVNLKAPIVLNTSLRKGKQVIASNDDYGMRHYIFKEVHQLQMGQVM